MKPLNGTHVESLFRFPKLSPADEAKVFQARRVKRGRGQRRNRRAKNGRKAVPLMFTLILRGVIKSPLR